MHAVYSVESAFYMLYVEVGTVRAGRDPVSCGAAHVLGHVHMCVSEF